MKFLDLIKFLEEDFISPFVSRSANVQAQGGQSGGTTNRDTENTFPNQNSGIIPIPAEMFKRVKKNKIKRKVRKKHS